MAGKSRSGLANHRRAYRYFKSTIPTYTLAYDGNTNTSGDAPTSAPYTSGSTITVLGNSGLAKTGFAFAGWNTAANGSGTSYSQGNTFIINADTTLFARWTPVAVLSPPTALSSVGGDQAAYILFTQVGTVTNYEYSTDDGETFVPFNPPQIHSPVEINTLSSDIETRLTNGTVYNIKLKAVNSGGPSIESLMVTATPTTNSLLSTNRIIYLDANNSSSYSGSGTAWTNLESGGSYSATLTGTPTFDTTTDPGNKYFAFNTGATTGQYAQIDQAAAINPAINTPFTIQMWVKINNVGSQGSLVSKMFDQSRDYDGYNFIYMADNALQLHLNGSSRDNRFKSITGVLHNGWALYTANVRFGGTNKIFVNGRQVLSAQSTESNIPSKTQNMTILSGFGGEGECDIGELYYYNTELSQTEIIQNFDASKPRYV
jgi:uncharacterized repeat protein (TIGR02543 family)